MEEDNFVPESLSRTYFWPHIRHQALKFEISLNEKGARHSHFIKYDVQKLEYAFTIYEKGWWFFKKKVYGPYAEEEIIDRHKIAALYILALLTAQPFSTIVPQNETVDRNFALANELFCIAVMKAILEAWNEEALKNLKMEANERKWFIILLNRLKTKIRKTDSYSMSDEAEVLSLSQLVFYIEKSYLESAK